MKSQVEGKYCRSCGQENKNSADRLTSIENANNSENGRALQKRYGIQNVLLTRLYPTNV